MISSTGDIVRNLKFIQDVTQTRKLWLQFMDFASIIEMFIRAERTGKFELPISPSEQMLLYLAAAGHDKYTVATQKYLQDIKNLCSWLEKKYEEGSFTICRNDKLFRGVTFNDHVTEQTLIRSEQHRDAHASRKKEKLSALSISSTFTIP